MIEHFLDVKLGVTETRLFLDITSKFSDPGNFCLHIWQKWIIDWNHQSGKLVGAENFKLFGLSGSQ